MLAAFAWIGLAVVCGGLFVGLGFLAATRPLRFLELWRADRVHNRSGTYLRWPEGLSNPGTRAAMCANLRVMGVGWVIFGTWFVYIFLSEVPDSMHNAGKAAPSVRVP